MTEFKVGDRVRFDPAYESTLECYKGATGEIIQIKRRAWGQTFVLSLDEPLPPGCWPNPHCQPDQLELLVEITTEELAEVYRSLGVPMPEEGTP